MVNCFYDLLKKCYETHHFKPEQIFNVDECGLSNVAKSRAKIISQKGRRQVGKLSSAERGQNVKIVVCHTKKTQRERNGLNGFYFIFMIII